MRLREILINHVDVYLPQIDGTLLVDEVAAGVPHEVAAKRVFNADTAALAHCDALLAVLNGRAIDEGVAFEIGVAWALGKTCVGYKDDVRQLLPSGDNPMLTSALDAVFLDTNEIMSWAVHYMPRR